MTMTNARRSPNTAATTPSIGAETSAWKPSRVADTRRRITRTARITTPNAIRTAERRSHGTGTVSMSPRSTSEPYPTGLARSMPVTLPLHRIERVKTTAPLIAATLALALLRRRLRVEPGSGDHSRDGEQVHRWPVDRHGRTQRQRLQSTCICRPVARRASRSTRHRRPRKFLSRVHPEGDRTRQDRVQPRHSRRLQPGASECGCRKKSAFPADALRDHRRLECGRGRTAERRRSASFREQQAGYLAGYAANLTARDRRGKVVSTVGGQKKSNT